MGENSESENGPSYEGQPTVNLSQVYAEAELELNKSPIGFVPKYVNTSCLCLKPDNSLRKIFIKLVHAAWFEYAIIGLILLNCLFLAMAKPHPLCCGDSELSTTIKTGFMPSADPRNAAGIIKCGPENELLNMDLSVTPGNGPRDEPGLINKVWLREKGQRCCVDPTLEGVMPATNAFTGLQATSTPQCNDLVINDISNAMEYVFLVAFSFEMFAKIIAMGLWSGKMDMKNGINGAYLRDTWNWLDFVVVIVAWLAMIPGVSNFSGLRTFRVLRPLKTMTAIPGMKTIVTSLLESLKSMSAVIMLATSLFLLFGILGVQLFAGMLEGQCFYLDQSAITPETGGWTADGDQGALCGLDVFPETSYLDASGATLDCRFEGFVAHNLGIAAANATYTEENPLVTSFPAACHASTHTATFGRTCSTRSYGNDTWSVEKGTMKCLPNGNPEGWASYDNIGVAVAWIFASITLEGWVASMYNIGNVYSDTSVWLWVIVFTYFTLMVILCNFVMLNLALAVIADEYTEQELLEKDAREKSREKFRQKYLADAYHIHDDIAVAAAKLKAQNGEEQFPDPWGGAIPRAFYKVAINKWFNGFVTGIIIINTVVMGLEKYPEDPVMVAVSNVLNLIFTFIFILEMIIKMIGLGLRGYAADSFNVFDGTVVTISIVELILAYLGTEGGGLAILRSLRLVRVFKLARSWTDLQNLLKTIMGSLADVTSAAMLMLLVVFIFALLGMQFFGGLWTSDAFGGGCERVNMTVTCDSDGVPRANFDDIGWSIITVFQVLTGENWNDLLWQGIAAGHYTVGSGMVGLLYFILLNLFGSYMIMNIFLAILLAGFDENDEEEEEEEESAPKGDIKSAKVAPDPSGNKYVVDEKQEDGADAVSSVPTKKEKEKHNTAFGRTQVGKLHENSSIEDIPSNEKEPEMVLAGKAFGCFDKSNNLRIKMFKMVSNPLFDNFILVCIIVSSAFLAMDEPWVSVCACYDGTVDIPSCYDTSRTSPRSFARMFPSGPTAEDPIKGNSLGYYQFLVWSDVIVTIIFVFEMISKILALGFVGGKHSYLRNPWNKLDFVIVWVAIISIFTGPLMTGFCSGDAGPSWLKALRSLRALRALRPLRVIRRYPGLKLVVNSIFKAAPQILNVCMVAMLFFLIFAIMGVQFFKGKIAFCNDGSIETQKECVGNFILTGADCGMLPLPDLQDQCVVNADAGYPFPRVWRSKVVNFDSVGNALVTIFEISSGEMWPDIMYDTIDGVYPGQAMMENYDRTKPAIYYVAVQIVCAMIMINVFCGVIIEKYNEMKDESEGSGLLTNEQKLWVETMKLAMSGRAEKTTVPPKKGLFFLPYQHRMKLYTFVAHPMFDYSIMACIAVNTLFMATRHADQGLIWDTVLETANMIFTVIFSIEAVLKLIGLGPEQYFSENWNRFDFTLVVLSWVGVLVNLGGIASLFRVLRVARMIRLLRKNRGLMDLLTTVMASVPAMANVVLLLLLFMFILSAIGMNLFANVKHGGEAGGPGELSEDANFMTFMMSFSTMWRMCTGESFNGIMHDVRIAPPYCDYEKGGMVDPNQGNCGVDHLAQLYFTMMFVVLNYIFVNMCMAIILDNFGDTQALAQSRIKAEHMEEFKEAWTKQDPRGTGWIKETQLELVLMEVTYPMGLMNIPMEHMHATTLRKFKNRTIQSLHLPNIDGKIEFKQTKKALVENVIGKMDDLPDGVAIVQDFQNQTQKLDKKILSNHKGTTRADTGGIQKCPTGQTRVTDLYGVNHTFAAKAIQAMFRQYKARHQVKRLKTIARQVIHERHLEKAEEAIQ